MNEILTSYQKVFDAHQKFSSLGPDHPDFRPAQKTLFSSLSHLFPQLRLPVVPALERDVYYHQAQQIHQGVTLQGKPALSSLASKYCLTFSELRSLLQNSPSPPADLKEKLNQLGKAHLQFAEAFIPELKKVKTPSITFLNYPQTLILILDAVFPEIQRLEELIATQDPGLMSMIPNLAIKQLLASRSPHVPELFRSHAEELYKKGFTYRDLSSDEKQNLHCKFLGEDVELQPATQELFKSINQLSSSLTRSESNPVFRATFIELEKAIALLKTLPKGPIATDKQAAKSLIQAYLSNPNLNEKDLPDALFDEKYRLPIRAMKPKGTEKEIERVSDMIADEPKAAPWLRILRGRNESRETIQYEISSFIP